MLSIFDILPDCIKTNTTLNTLILDSNETGEKGVIDIAEGLKTNKSLTKLDLSDNTAGDIGYAAIAEMLKTNNKMFDKSIMSVKKCSELFIIPHTLFEKYMKNNILFTKYRYFF